MTKAILLVEDNPGDARLIEGEKKLLTVEADKSDVRSRRQAWGGFADYHGSASCECAFAAQHGFELVAQLANLGRPLGAAPLPQF